MKSILVLLSVMALLCSSARAEEFTAKVIEVLDGDTVLIKRANGLQKVRLAEIDAPEKAQPFGSASQQSLSGMVMKKQVKFVSETMDQYGRLVAHLSIDGLDVNAEQVRRGMAWEYSNFHSNKKLIALQQEAMQVPRGLWAQSSPTPPWAWRKLHPSTLPSSSALTPAGCGKKRQCWEMVSCEEVQFYFTQCGIKSLDGDGDGTPCEELCSPQKKVSK